MANNDNQPTKNNNPDLALYYLLHKNPIYKYVKGQENIHIMILGAGDWAMRFIGIALQTCQVVGRTVTITVACDDPENTAKDYLRIRPAVPEFVTIKFFDMNGLFRIVKGLNEDGKLDFANESLEKKEMYGTLNFVTCSFKNAEREDAVVINNLVTKFGKPQYVFIDLAQNDTYNYDIAKAFKNVVRDIDSAQDDFGFINFVVKNENVTDEFTGFNPVFVSQVISVTDKDPLDQMAFNAHLSWYNTLNIDQIAERKKFEEDTYNYNSSLAFVLSIPYKLWSIGILNTNDDVVQEPVVTLAAEFQKLLDKPEQRAKYLKLIQLEHRRWVLEKICDNEKGWQPPDVIDDAFVNDCINRCKVKDSVKRIHPCLVRSTEAMPLKDKYYFEEPREGWKEPKEGDGKADDTPIKDIKDLKFAYSRSCGEKNKSLFEKLDALDRMSVQLHRLFYKAAQEVIKRKPLENEDSAISVLEKLLFGEENDVLRAFNRYRYCIKNILAGNKAYSKQFEHVQNDFEKILEGIQPDKKAVIFGSEKDKGLLKNIAGMLFPVIESNLYRDYKSLDEDLIKNLPFILTYKQVQELIIVFDDGLKEYGRKNNNAVFQNVASATVLNPKCITYLYYCDTTNEDILIDKFVTVLEYLFKRIVGCNITLAIAFKREYKWEGKEVDNFISKIKERITHDKKGEEQQLNFEIKVCQDQNEAIEFYKEVITGANDAVYDATTELFDSDNEEYDEYWKNALPHFKFSKFKNKHFVDVKKCDFLKYIEKGTVIDKTCLKVEDMFSLMNAKNKKYYVPEFVDAYEQLWGIYKGDLLYGEDSEKWGKGVSNWTALCNKLLNYVKDKTGNNNEENTDKRAGRIDKDKNDIEIELNSGINNIEYVFPKEFTQNVQDFCQKLYDLKILKEEPKVEEGKVKITTAYDLDETLFKRLFKEESICAYFTGGWLNARREARPEKEILIISYNNLKVDNLKLNYRLRKILENISKITLDRYSGIKCIKNLKPGRENGTVSFEFATEHIKKLLCTAGEILEIYTYFEVLKTGYFDDVVCSYEFQWESGVENELDCILTKGFKTLIIECKARAELEPEFYHKLANISNVIGIAEKPVLLANTYKQSNKLNNKKLIENGNLMGVITISGQEDIEQIGQNLCAIMEGKKSGKDFMEEENGGKNHV